MLKLYGSRLAGLFGYTRLLGGYEGCEWRQQQQLLL